jgi:hypothetical protein
MPSSWTGPDAKTKRVWSPTTSNAATRSPAAAPEARTVAVVKIASMDGLIVASFPGAGAVSRRPAVSCRTGPEHEWTRGAVRLD